MTVVSGSKNAYAVAIFLLAGSVWINKHTGEKFAVGRQPFFVFKSFSG